MSEYPRQPFEQLENAEKDRWYQRYTFILESLEETFTLLSLQTDVGDEVIEEYNQIYEDVFDDQARIESTGPRSSTEEETIMKEVEKRVQDFNGRVREMYPDIEIEAKDPSNIETLN